jgi:hypothetical protein
LGAFAKPDVAFWHAAQIAPGAAAYFILDGPRSSTVPRILQIFCRSV